MATITTLRVESVRITENDLTWTDVNPAQAPTVNRAPFGGAFTALATLAAGVQSFIDSAAVTGTRYQYKVTQTAGDSNIVDVVTQVCVVVGSQPAPLVTIPQMNDPLTAAQANSMIDQLNQTLLGTNDPAVPCTICPTNGSIILDCSQCTNFTVQVNQDINSISMVGCTSAGGGLGNINFVIPSGLRFCISGFPDAFRADSGCTFLSGGAFGTTYGAPFGKGPKSPAVGVAPGGGGGGGAGSCVCVPTSGNVLTITCCTAKCSIQCGTTTGGLQATGDANGSKKLNLVACGGVAPYTWSTTNGKLSTTAGSSTTLTPPDNTGSGVAGVAYDVHGCKSAGPDTGRTDYGCNDQSLGGTSPQGHNCHAANNCASCTEQLCTFPLPCTCSDQGPCAGQSGGTLSLLATPFDLRTPAMVAAGCSPCGLMGGSVVTVTDAVGTAVSKTILA